MVRLPGATEESTAKPAIAARNSAGSYFSVWLVWPGNAMTGRACDGLLVGNLLDSLGIPALQPAYGPMRATWQSVLFIARLEPGIGHYSERSLSGCLLLRATTATKVVMCLVHLLSVKAHPGTHLQRQRQSLWPLGGTPDPAGRQASGSRLGCSPLPPTQKSRPHLPLHWPAALWVPERPMVLVLPAWQLRCRRLPQGLFTRRPSAQPNPHQLLTGAGVDICSIVDMDSAVGSSSPRPPSKQS